MKIYREVSKVVMTQVVDHVECDFCGHLFSPAERIIRISMEWDVPFGKMTDVPKDLKFPNTHYEYTADTCQECFIKFHRQWMTQHDDKQIRFSQ